MQLIQHAKMINGVGKQKAEVSHFHVMQA